MPGNERQRRPEEVGNNGSGKEAEMRPAYLDVRRFPDGESAARAYQEGQQALQRDLGASNVSLFRIQVGSELTPHVVALGDSLEPMLRKKLEIAFASGERVTLDAAIVEYLVSRREEARGLGPWVEAHHRPGQPVWLENRRRPAGQENAEKPRRQEKPKKQSGFWSRSRRRGSWKKRRH